MASGVGEWDKFLVAISMARGPMPKARPVLADGAPARACASSPTAMPVRYRSGHAEGAIWDDGSDPVGELRRVSAIRRAAVDRFGFNSVPAGAPMAELRRAFVPIWLLDRYQVEAASKSLGGLVYPVRAGGRARSPRRPVPAAQQQAALAALLATLDEGALTVPAYLLAAAQRRIGRRRRPAKRDRANADQRAATSSIR